MSRSIISEEDFEEVKKLQETGLNSRKSAQQLSLNWMEVNKAYLHDSHEEYADEDNNISDEIEEIEEDSPAPVSEGRKGHLRSIITSGREKGDKPMVKAQQSLLASIKGQWDFNSLLQMKKIQLEKEIHMMEEYLQRGIDFIEENIEK